MAIITCWALKGGSGTTVVAAGIALSEPGAVLIDLDGELPAALGIVEPAGQGITEWLTSDAPPSAIDDLAIAVGHHTLLVPRGADDLVGDEARWAALARWMAADPRLFVVDAGTGSPRDALTAAAHETGACDLLVTRPCYLALRRLGRTTHRPSGVVVIAARERALGPRDVAHAVGAPVVAQVPDDPAIARAVDAGLLSARVPHTLLKPLRAMGARCASSDLSPHPDLPRRHGTTHGGT